MKTEHSDAETVEASVNPVDDAVRLYLIECALQHLMRQAGLLGLAANATQQALRAEREIVVKRLMVLGENPAFAA